MKLMRIVVTGGAGFIASHIVDKYIELGHEVIVIDDLSSGKKEYVHPKAIFYEASILDKDKIRAIFQRVKPEILNHHAAQISVRHSVDDPLFDANVNIIGLINLLETGRLYNLKKVIFASSGGAIYGDAQNLPTPEDYQPQNPLSPYGISKLTGEKYLYFYWKNYQIPFTTLRYGNVYGPRQNPHGEAGVIAIFSSKIVNGEIPTINGDGTQTRDYIYVSDIVEANTKVLNDQKSEIYNVGTSVETDVNTLFKKLITISGSHISAIHGPPKKGEQMKSALDTTLIQQKLGWKVQFDLVKGLENTYQYFLQHKNEQ